MVGAGGEPLFPFSWNPGPKSIVRGDSRVLPYLDSEVIHVLDCFFPQECNTLITRDREDDNEMDEYLGKSKYFLSAFPLYGCSIMDYLM